MLHTAASDYRRQATNQPSLTTYAVIARVGHRRASMHDRPFQKRWESRTNHPPAWEGSQLHAFGLLGATVSRDELGTLENVCQIAEVASNQPPAAQNSSRRGWLLSVLFATKYRYGSVVLSVCVHRCSMQGLFHKMMTTLALACLFFTTTGLSWIHPSFHSGEACCSHGTPPRHVARQHCIHSQGQATKKLDCCHSHDQPTSLDDQQAAINGIEARDGSNCVLCRFLRTFQSDTPHIQSAHFFGSVRLRCPLPNDTCVREHCSRFCAPRGPPAYDSV